MAHHWGPVSGHSFTGWSGLQQRVLSVLCEPVSTWQSSVHELTPSGSKHLPLRQGSGAALLECGAVDEVAFLSKVVVKRGVN